MINQIVLVGKLDRMSNLESKKDLYLKVERPFKENNEFKIDIFKCRAWISIFDKVLNLCKGGDLLAIKGRAIYEEGEFIVIAENIVILNKYLDNI